MERNIIFKWNSIFQIFTTFILPTSIILFPFKFSTCWFAALTPPLLKISVLIPHFLHPCVTHQTLWKSISSELQIISFYSFCFSTDKVQLKNLGKKNTVDKRHLYASSKSDKNWVTSTMLSLFQALWCGNNLTTFAFASWQTKTGIQLIPAW